MAGYCTQEGAARPEQRWRWRAAGMKVRGDSMETTLAYGDWALVDLPAGIRQEGTVSGTSSACSASPVARCT